MTPPYSIKGLGLVRALLLQSIGVSFFVGGCAAGEPTSRHPSSNPCGPHGKPWENPARVIAQSVEPDGTIIDWIPAPATAPPNVPADPIGNETSMAQTRGPTYGGPPGTVPIPHPRVLSCTCDPGYISRPGQPCVELGQICEPEGAAASSKYFTQCCAGLTQVLDVRPVNGQCVQFGPDYGICTRCGNGTCGAGENSCNCPADCRR